MKKTITSLLLASLVLFAAESEHKQQHPTDCIESLQNEIIGIIYSNAIKKNNSIEVLTDKINKTFERDCDVNTTESKEERKARLLAEEEKAEAEYILVLDANKGGEACIEALQNEIAKIVHSTPEKIGKEKAIKVIIKGDTSNCITEGEKK